MCKFWKFDSKRVDFSGCGNGEIFLLSVMFVFVGFYDYGYGGVWI